MNKIGLMEKLQKIDDRKELAQEIERQAIYLQYLEATGAKLNKRGRLSYE